MSDSEDEINLQAECRWCRKDLYRVREKSQRIDIYELEHHWGIESFERTPDGRLELADFVGRPFQLLGKFCSAECLVGYVKAHIEPDTLGGDDQAS